MTAQTPQQGTGDSKVTERMAAEWSPRFKARVAGIFYLLEALTAVFGQLYVPGMLVVSGDAAATATNILGNEPLFRLSLAATLIAVACHIVWVLLFYDLFKPVNRSISLLAAFFGLVAIALQAVSGVVWRTRRNSNHLLASD